MNPQTGDLEKAKPVEVWFELADEGMIDGKQLPPRAAQHIAEGTGRGLVADACRDSMRRVPATLRGSADL
jgi:hypothetical protein